MIFSRKQQHVLAICCLCYGLWFSWSFHAGEQGQTASEQLSEPTSVSIPFYLDPPVNLNTANAAELQFLPQIGPVLADRIVAYREQHGAFQTLHSLQNVYGIGPKTVQRLQYYLDIEE